MAPYLLNAGTVCYAKNVSVITPMAHRTPFGIATNFDYLLFEDIFVSPFVENSTSKSIEFPGRYKDEWVYWFGVNMSYTGGQTVKDFNCSFDEYPVFLRKGSIVPLNIQSRHSKLGGSEHSKTYQTVMITRPSHGNHSRLIHEHQADGYAVWYSYDELQMELEVRISAHDSNLFNIFINGLNHRLPGLGRPVRASIYRQESNSFEPIDWHNPGSDGDEEDVRFWKSPSNLVKLIDSHRVFVKLGESSRRGFVVRISNV